MNINFVLLSLQRLQRWAMSLAILKFQSEEVRVCVRGGNMIWNQNWDWKRTKDTTDDPWTLDYKEISRLGKEAKLWFQVRRPLQRQEKPHLLMEEHI